MECKDGWTRSVLGARVSYSIIRGGTKSTSICCRMIPWNLGKKPRGAGWIGTRADKQYVRTKLTLQQWKTIFVQTRASTKPLNAHPKERKRELKRIIAADKKFRPAWIRPITRRGQLKEKWLGVEYLNLADTSPSLVGYNGGFATGSHTYYAPYNNGVYHGNIVRIARNAEFELVGDDTMWITNHRSSLRFQATKLNPIHRLEPPDAKEIAGALPPFCHRAA